MKRVQRTFDVSGTHHRYGFVGGVQEPLYAVYDIEQVTGGFVGTLAPHYRGWVPAGSFKRLRPFLNGVLPEQITARRLRDFEPLLEELTEKCVALDPRYAAIPKSQDSDGREDNPMRSTKFDFSPHYLQRVDPAAVKKLGIFDASGEHLTPQAVSVMGDLAEQFREQLYDLVDGEVWIKWVDRDKGALRITLDGAKFSKKDADSLLSSLLEGAVDELSDDREDNPASGLSLGSVALGAALGAAAMHLTMKRKQ